MYKSPFMRVKCSEEGMQKINFIQREFDGAYRSLHRDCQLAPTQELKQAVLLMQQACMMYTRACALQHDEDNPFEWKPRKDKK